MMKKQYIVLLILIIALYGCSGADRIDEIKPFYAGAESIVAQLDIATYTEAVMQYSIDYSSKQEASQVTITAPDILRGVSAVVTGSDCRIEYAGSVAQTLLPGIPGYAPVDAMHGVVDSLSQGIVNNYNTESVDGVKCLALSYITSYEEYECQKRIWLEEENLSIVKAEFYINGSMVMTLQTKMFQLY